jgi:membrane protease YdiL (CAAX protease family)
MKTVKRIIALIIIVLIPVVIMIWLRNHLSTGFASSELIKFPLIFGITGIIIIYAVKRYFLNENIRDFNKSKGSILKDLLLGLTLAVVYFILFFIFRITLSNILSFNQNTELLNLMIDMRENPFLIILWFGPVLVIGIAMFEELMRAFTLTILWDLNNSKLWIYISIIISATITGLTHWSQGSYGIVTIGLKSIITGLFYLKYRRLLPLIVAHILYDGVQVAFFLITYNQ